ncbi:MAG: ClpXP protease specificity-enhancing factor SspB [Pseudomonadota bacterium]
MTDDTPPDSLIPYDEYVPNALRGVVYLTLANIASEGALPGKHHFYIAFKTRAPGVDIPPHLLERYPEEMTIVVQHRYWDLKVTREGFEIGLSFNQVPAKLAVPFDAVVGFVDPSVDFALQFPPPDLPKAALKSVSPGDSNAGAAANKDSTAKDPAAGADDGKQTEGDNVVAVDFRKK